MREILEDIRAKLKDGAYEREAHVQFSLVARIIQGLGWDIWNPREVNSEYMVAPEEDRTRVDVALFLDSALPSVFIEAKAPGKLDGPWQIGEAETQARDYNRDLTAMLSVITDGRKWRFYYPQSGGAFKDKLFLTLDLLEHPLDDLQLFFDCLLSKVEINSGRAKEEARRLLEEARKERAAAEARQREAERAEERLSEQQQDAAMERPSYAASVKLWLLDYLQDGEPHFTDDVRLALISDGLLVAPESAPQEYMRQWTHIRHIASMLGLSGHAGRSLWQLGSKAASGSGDEADSRGAS